MRREEMRGGSVVERPSNEVEEGTEAPMQTRFSAAEPLPEVGGGFEQPGPSASDRAYGAPFIDRLPPEIVKLIRTAGAEQLAGIANAHPEIAAPITVAVDQMRGAAFAQQVATGMHTLHKPTPPASTEAGTSTPTTHAASQPSPAPAMDPDRAKRVARGMTAAWDQLAAGTPDERATPEHVRLPPNIVKQLEQAWQDSLSGKREREQGGNLVRNYGGGYEIRRRANEDHHMFDQDDNDVGWTQKLVAQVHTHPYRDEKDRVPEQFATFSEGDFDSLMRSDAHMSVLRSGPYTFILTKTKQFNALVDATNNDEEKLSALAKRMTAVYDKAFEATTGKFSEKTEAGVMAVCQQFHLVYYVGQGSDLTRKTKRPRS